MKYDLPNTDEPDLVIIIEAKFAEAGVAAARIAQRMMEITASVNAKLGVICTPTTQMVGRIDITGPSIEGPVPIDEFGGRMKLTEQRAIVSEFRRSFGGHWKQAMTSVSHALGGLPVYFIFYEMGMVAAVPNTRVKDRWRLASIRMDGARTMEEERLCVVVNRTSREIYSVLWELLIEKARREADEDPTLTYDAIGEAGDLSAPSRSKGPDPYRDAPPRTALHDEEDMLEDNALEYADPTDHGMPDREYDPADFDASGYEGAGYDRGMDEDDGYVPQPPVPPADDGSGFDLDDVQF
jgi:hypothetical protein